VAGPPSDIDFPCGDGRVAAYRALPGRGRGRGVLVVHGGFGLDGFAREACDRLARSGFVALAPDLLGGRTTADPADAASRAAGLDAGAAARVLEAAIAELFACDATEGARVGALGFGSGGALALRAAAASRRVGAVVDVEGALPEAAPAALEIPVLALFGAEDEAVAKGAVRELESRLGEAGARVRVRLLAGAGLGFADPARADVYAAAAAADAWDALLAFLAAEL
jgi:carboxymethylenebutenolidase